MIKVLCQTMTSSYDSSLKVKVMEYNNLKSFKEEVLRHYPKIDISLPQENEKLWYGIQYGSTVDGFWFRWLMAIIDTERGCLYSNGDYNCVNYLGLPKGKQHCSKEVYTILEEIKNEVENKKENIVFIE